MIVKLIDRQMIRGYFKSYLVCLASLLSLYVVVDLFINLDDFTHHSNGLLASLRHIFTYYSYKVTQIFDRLCEAIVLLAAMFTVAWMQRNNEQMPLLSAGVSTRRIVLPVLMSAFFMLSLTVVNQEFMIPRIADKLAQDRDDPGGQKSVAVRTAFDIVRHGHITGRPGRCAQDRNVTNINATILENRRCGQLIHLTAQKAITSPVPGRVRAVGSWWALVRWKCRPSPAFSISATGPLFPAHARRRFRGGDAQSQLVHHGLDAAALRRIAASRIGAHGGDGGAVPHAADSADPGHGVGVAGTVGDSADQNRNVIISSGMCLVLCGVFFAACYACKMLGDNEYLNPAVGVDAGAVFRAACWSCSTPCIREPLAA